MARDITTILKFTIQKDGMYKIVIKERPFYQFLFHLGFRKTKLNKAVVFFQRIEAEIKLKQFYDIRDAFPELLRKLEFTNIPDGVEYTDILNWYHQNRPIKRNAEFDNCLYEDLNASDTHVLMLQNDASYAHNFKIKTVLEKLEEWGFKTSIDQAGGFHKGNTIHYRYVGNNNYIVFNYFNPKSPRESGFDSWTAVFAHESHVGNKMPLGLEQIRFSFQLERDYPLIEQYLK